MGVGGRCRRYGANEEVGPDDMTNEGLVGLGVRREALSGDSPTWRAHMCAEGRQEKCSFGGGWELGGQFHNI